MIKEIADAINDFGAYVIQSYATSIAHFSKYAAIVAEFAGDCSRSPKKRSLSMVAAIETKILEALGQFMEETGREIESVIAYRKEIDGKMGEIIT